jgi:hypothetical protein
VRDEVVGFSVALDHQSFDRDTTILGDVVEFASNANIRILHGSKLTIDADVLALNGPVVVDCRGDAGIAGAPQTLVREIHSFGTTPGAEHDHWVAGPQDYDKGFDGNSGGDGGPGGSLILRCATVRGGGPIQVLVEGGTEGDPGAGGQSVFICNAHPAESKPGHVGDSGPRGRIGPNGGYSIVRKDVSKSATLEVGSVILTAREHSVEVFRPGMPVVQGQYESVYDPRLRSHVSVRDVRLETAVKTPIRPTLFEIERFLTRRKSGAHALGQLQAGVGFRPRRLQFRDATSAHYCLAAPAVMGGPRNADLLYMTSSNRASKGCEALLSYWKGRDYAAAFGVWDWSQPDVAGGGKFYVYISLDEMQRYIVSYEVSTPNGLLNVKALNITSATTRIDGVRWRNDVFLHNNVTGNRDRIWTSAFEWADQNPEDDAMWWGPIFEAFPNDTVLGPANLLGFTDACLVQDGQTMELADGNSYLVEPQKDGLHTEYRVRNSSLLAR